MPILAICPECSKTIIVERIPKIACPECGNQFNFVELQKNKLIIDASTEAAELAAARDNYAKNDYVRAADHFKRAYEANKNSYTAQYYLALCEIYKNIADSAYNVMGRVVDMVRSSLITMSRANVAVTDKFAFITTMLSEIKTIITRRLNARDGLFESDIDAYRKVSISDLTDLINLFKIDRELIMSFAPQVAAAMTELADCAIKVCYKSVQTVMVGDKLYTPNDADYKRIMSLCNEYCFFAHSFDPAFDTKEYSPDFTPNYVYNDKVLRRFKKFDEANQINAKKHLISNIGEYENILEECKRALEFTYLNCYRSMCSRQVKQHSQLFFNGFELLFRLMTPRVVAADKKRVEIRVEKFADTVDRCDILTRFLVDAYELDPGIGGSLHAFYEKLYSIVSMYYLPEFDKLSKNINKIMEIRGDEYFAYQKLLFDCACCCAPALRKYVDFSAEPDKTRNKLVKICKRVTDDFLLLSNFRIDELEQSNFYRPILQITTAVMDETEE